METAGQFYLRTGKMRKRGRMSERTDTERLDWLAAQGKYNVFTHNIPFTLQCAGDWSEMFGVDVRQAIDAAIDAEMDKL